MSLLASSKTVLIMEDEGLQIFTTGGKGVAQVDSIPWDADKFTQTVSQILVRKCKKNPVVILNDMVEQHYRKEQLPKTNVTDRAAILKRKLISTFPNYRIRSALKLKGSAKKDRNMGDMYLFAAIPRSESIKKTISAVQRSGAGVIGLYLLPVEGVQMVSELSKKLSTKTKDKSRWTIFLGQQNHGSLRQIVVRNGELALTRMTPIVDTDIEPDLWAKELSSELDSTMSYLSRFGYQPGDAVEIFVVANEETHSKVKQFIDVDADVYTLTAQQAGRTLGAPVEPKESGRYAYSVYSGFIAKSSKFVLPLEADALQQYKRPRQIAILAIGLLLIGLLGMSYKNFVEWTGYQQLQDQIDVSSQRIDGQQQEFDRQLDIAKQVGFDYALIEGTIDAYDKIQDNSFDLFLVMRAVGLALGPNLRIDKLTLQEEEVKNDQDNGFQYEEEDSSQKEMESVLTLNISFPALDDPTEAIEVVENLAVMIDTNLTSQITPYEVVVTKQIADFSFTGDVSGGGEKSQEEQVYQAEIQIRRIFEKVDEDVN